jgi:hypothetical protein
VGWEELKCKVPVGLLIWCLLRDHEAISFEESVIAQSNIAQRALDQVIRWESDPREPPEAVSLSSDCDLIWPTGRVRDAHSKASPGDNECGRSPSSL